MVKYSVTLIKGKDQFTIQADSMDELANEIWKLKQMGFTSFFEGVDNFSAKTVDKIFDSFDRPADSLPPFCCPIHKGEKIYQDKGGSGKYCGCKVNDKWCGAKFDKNGTLTRLPNTMQATQNEIDF